MRAHFKGDKQTEKRPNTAYDANNNVQTAEKDTLKIELRNETEIVANDEERICSYSFVSKDEKRYPESFVHFLRRTGYPDAYLPETLIQIIEANRLKDEIAKQKHNLCPYIVNLLIIYNLCFNEF